jgi:hypothetical protein
MMAGQFLTSGVLTLASAALVKYLFSVSNSAPEFDEWFALRTCIAKIRNGEPAGWVAPANCGKTISYISNNGSLQTQRRKNMNNKSIAKPRIAAVLELTAALGPAWAQSSTIALPAQTSGAEQTLTGTVVSSWRGTAATWTDMAEGAPPSPDAPMETLSWSIPFRR